MATQQTIDEFYKKNGDCCAGCDWWRWFNSVTGECKKNAPVSETERIAVIEILSHTYDIGAGHILTNRDHVCGDFIDSHNWDLND